MNQIQASSLSLSLYIYIYIYTHTHTHTHTKLRYNPLISVDPREEDILPRPHFTESYEASYHGNKSQTSNDMITGRQTVITDTRQAYENTGTTSSIDNGTDHQNHHHYH